MNLNKFCELLTKLRKERELTQEQLAEKLCVSAKTVSKWETGGSTPDISRLDDIAKFFDMNLYEFLALCSDNDVNVELSNGLNSYSKKYNKRLSIIIILSTLLIITLSVIFAKKYYESKMFYVTSQNEVLNINGYYLDNVKDSKVIINNIKYNYALNNVDKEIMTNKIKINLYDQDNKFITSLEEQADSDKEINSLLKNIDISIDRRLKTNNIFDNNYKTLIIEIEYSEGKLRDIVKVY